VFGYPWVVLKLAFIVSVICVGAFISRPGSSDLVDGTDTTGRLIADRDRAERVRAGSRLPTRHPPTNDMTPSS
jgi:hypothetical protein